MFGMCTCCKSCVIYYDEFTRPDKNQLDNPWMNEGKDFSVKSGCAVPNEPESEAILKVPHPNNRTVMVAQMQTLDEPIEKGVVYRLIVNAVIDEATPPSTQDVCESYYFADFVRNGMNDSIIRLGVHSAGSDTILKQDVVLGLTGTQRIFYARFGEYEFCAGVESAVLSQVVIPIGDGVAYQDGVYSGMGARLSDDRANLEGIDMDDPDTPIVKIAWFKFLDHFDNNKLCQSCICKCDQSHLLPPTLYVRIWPDPDDCPRLDLLKPCEFEIHWNRVDATWRGEKMCCESPYYQSGQRFELVFSCPGTNYYGELDPEQAAAALLDGCLNSCGKPPGTCGRLDLASASCEPMEFTFGPVFVSASDLLCWCTTKDQISDLFTRGSCNYYVTIYWEP